MKKSVIIERKLWRVQSIQDSVINSLLSQVEKELGPGVKYSYKTIFKYNGNTPGTCVDSITVTLDVSVQEDPEDEILLRND